MNPDQHLGRKTQALIGGTPQDYGVLADRQQIDAHASASRTWFNRGNANA